MRGEAKRDMEGVPIACDPAALTAEQRERKRSLQRLLGANLRELRELEHGYAFRHSPDEIVLLAVAEFVALERLCCPFFDFGIEVGRSGGPVWFRMTGEEQAKIVLEAELGISA